MEVSFYPPYLVRLDIFFLFFSFLSPYAWNVYFIFSLLFSPFVFSFLFYFLFILYEKLAPKKLHRKIMLDKLCIFFRDMLDNNN